MGFFESINPFSYMTPVYADASAIETTPISIVVAADPVEVEATMIDIIEPKEAAVKAESNAEEEGEEEEGEEEDEDEEEEDEDPAVAIKEVCSKTMSSKAMYHHYEVCAARVEAGSSESCAEDVIGRRQGTLHSTSTGMTRPSVARTAGRRFIAAVAMRHYVSGGPLRHLASGKLFMTMLGSLAHMLRFALRLPVMLITTAIASLAYIEYKLEQINAPGWVTGGLEKMRGWLEGVRESEWLRSSSSDTGSGDNSTNDRAVDHVRGQHNGWGSGGGIDPSDSGSDPSVGGNGIPPPKGDYYTAPDNSSQEDDHRETPKTPKSDKPTRPTNHNDDNALMELTKKLLEIQTILKTVRQDGDESKDNGGSALQLPSIVVIGSQSSGKSSVLEAIVGQEFLPKGTNMVTRRPIELTLINTPDSDEEYGEFPQLGLDRIRDFRRIQRTLYDLNMSVPDTECVSDKPVELRIYSPHVPDLRLVDLPGYIQVVNRKQPPVLRQKIRDLCESYLKQPNIILAVCAADVDLANSEALKASRRNDPLGVRTIGVITKVDTAEPNTAVHMLTQNDYPLHLGYIGVVCKPVKERVGRVPHEIVLSEAQYFGRHTEFQQPGVQIGVGTLRQKLVRVLEESMRRSLSTLVDAVRGELEETRYQIKVHYNDERISPESYMAESLDVLKQRFKAFQQQFGKPQLRAEVQRWLESQVLNVCAELYWSNPAVRDLSNHVTRSRVGGWWADISAKASQTAGAATGLIKELLAADTAKEQKGPRLSKTQDSSKDGGGDRARGKNGQQSPNEWSESDDMYWGHQLDRASALLTKSGVGRWTTQMVVDLLMDSVVSMVDTEPFVHHPDTRAAVLNFTHTILRNKYHPTVDQVENTIKPFKYEIEIEPHEWNKARKRSTVLVDNEIRLCRQALTRTRSKVPRKQLQQAIQFVRSAEKRGLNPVTIQAELARRNAEQTSDDRTPEAKPDSSESGAVSGDESPQTSVDEMSYAQFSPRLLRHAQHTLMVQDRLSVLHLRRKALMSNACASAENKRFCPEAFLDVVAEKLAYNAVLFINYELLQDFFFQFPRELDANLYYGKTLQQTRDFASQNPRIGQQLRLLERRQKLEMVMTRLHELVRQQTASEQRDYRTAADSGSLSSPSHNRPFPGL
ncbi:mitochondrial dynamin GTPase Msp1 [Coemansia sp. RSA 988]|nr:mitochondrial dynamin GTPase Msp1 [Coemansia sp. RSA 988]